MKTLVALLLAVLFCTSAKCYAAYPSAIEQKYQLNNQNGALSRRLSLGTQLVEKKVHLMKATYNFAVQGGVAGTINLKDSDGFNAVLPSGAIIKQVLIDVVTVPTSSSSATIALTAQSAGDLKAALAYSSYSGLVDGIPVGSAATMIKLTAQRTLSATIGVGPLTAGALNVLIEYYLTD